MNIAACCQMGAPFVSGEHFHRRSRLLLGAFASLRETKHKLCGARHPGRRGSRLQGSATRPCRRATTRCFCWCPALPGCHPSGWTATCTASGALNAGCWHSAADDAGWRSYRGCRQGCRRWRLEQPWPCSTRGSLPAQVSAPGTGWCEEQQLHSLQHPLAALALSLPPCCRFYKTASGVKVQVLAEGNTGPTAAAGDTVLVDFVLRRSNGACTEVCWSPCHCAVWCTVCKSSNTCVAACCVHDIIAAAYPSLLCLPWPCGAGYFIYATVDGVSFQPKDVPVGPVRLSLVSVEGHRPNIAAALPAAGQSTKHMLWYGVSVQLRCPVKSV